MSSISPQEISYLSKDFSQFKKNLLKLAKTYYPTTNADFSPSSVSSMFIDTVAATGDILSFYTDHQLQEAIPQYTSERKNVVAHAQSRGYIPRTSTAAQVMLTLQQRIPAITDIDGNISPNYTYCQPIKAGLQVSSDTGIVFTVTNPVDFSVDSKVSVYSRNKAGVPVEYVLEKRVPAISAMVKTETVSVGESAQFYRIYLTDKTVLGILSVVDSDGHDWYETDYIANGLIRKDSINLTTDKSATAILSHIYTQRRFIVRITDTNSTYLEFGAGIVDIIDTDSLIRNASSGIRSIDSFIDKNSILSSTSYGISPDNTTLTITYLSGGGTDTNVAANTINKISRAEYYGDPNQLNTIDRDIIQKVKRSLTVTNTECATGGRGEESTEEIREKMLATYQCQGRLVTPEDYKIRCLTMPAKYGSIEKVNVVKAQDGSISLYVLSLDSNGRLIPATNLVKNNLKEYLSEFKLLTDEINIFDGYIINIGVNFSINCFKNFNKKEVLDNCLLQVREYLSLRNLDFNSTISISRLELLIGNVSGVHSINYVNFSNLTNMNGDYSDKEYDLSIATINGIIYPSIDPAIFEVKYPLKDIVGKV